MKAVVLALLFIAFFYGFYCGVMAIWSYFAMASIVDDAVTERGRAAAAPVRDYIIKSAAESGVRIQDRNVVVTTDAEGESVRNVSQALIAPGRSSFA